MPLDPAFVLLFPSEVSRPRILSLFLALAILPISASILRAQPYLFTITDLGTLGGQESQANAVNDYGQVAGMAMIPSNSYRAFGYWNGVMYDLGTLGGDYSAAAGINNQGQIVGQSTWPNALINHAFSFANGVMHDLGTFGGESSTATAINNGGVIVGTAATSSNANHAFAFTTDGVMHDLGTFGGDTSWATAVNDKNVIVGFSNITNGDDQEFGFVFSGGSMQFLAALGGPGPPYNLVFPYGISNSGQITGSVAANVLNDTLIGFVYSGGTTTGFQAYDTSTAAEGINDAGLVVGYAANPVTAGSGMVAYIYFGGAIIDLNTLVDLSGSNFTQLTDAAAISNTDYIVGTGTTKSGYPHAYLLTLIATPSALKRAVGAP